MPINPVPVSGSTVRPTTPPTEHTHPTKPQPAMDPPAYTATLTNGDSHLPTPPPPTKRTILEMRALILGNAAILRPRKRDDDIHLILAKHTSPRQASAEEVPPQQHYAFLVQRKVTETDIQIMLKGEPRDSIEEALEWMLERTQTVVGEVLARHGTHTSGGCCMECARSINPRTRAGAVVAAAMGNAASR
ncbi:hypothetical protein LTR87_014942 [Friedmanniomyces endolithicus]|nr:hypothetical protein LTR87_014942 [Friedmanniomyces endolithicus]